MSTAEILSFFETVRVRDLVSFRALCNALKALLIKESVGAWRSAARGRLTVLDLGCGRGGDLRKWACYRLRNYVGADGAALCVQEARQRHVSMVAQGKSSTQALFHRTDLTIDAFPCEDAAVDIAAGMFFLQFAFASMEKAAHVVREAARVLRDNGILCCILPDGDRVASLLRDRRRQVAFGHFRLRGGGEACAAHLDSAAAPVGVAYSFALTDQFCTEFIVSPVLLQQLLSENFEGACAGGGFLEGAQSFFARGAESEAVQGVLRGQRCAQVDWMSLGFFQVLLAKRKPR